MRWSTFALLQALCGVCCAIPVSAATIADSQLDWSADGTQGENGWTYGWYNLTRDADATYAASDFNPFLNDGSSVVDSDEVNHWNGGAWALYRDTAATIGSETGPWTTIDQVGGHPNGTNSPAPVSVDEPEQAEHWAIRRWVSSYAGETSLISTLADTNTGCGNGTALELYHNGTLVNKLVTSSAGGVTQTVGRTLAVGDILDLALTPEGVDTARGDGCDSSAFRLQVTDDPPPPPPVPALADSADDWSTTGTQGERNWFNGFYNLSADDDGVYQASDFVAFTNSEGPAGGPTEPDGNHWNGTQWDMTGEAVGPWTELGRTTTHPNGTNSAPGEEHWTVRRYVANGLTQTTPLEINWETAKTNLGGGNGVTGALFVNGEQVDSATVAFNDGVGVARKFYVNAEPGDVIDLALTPNGSDGADGSRNRLTLRTDLPDGPLYNPGETLADSVGEFSEEQGQNNWYYGYYDQLQDANEGDGKYSAAEFIPFLNDGSGIVSDDPAIEGWKESENHWNGAQWDLLNNGAPDAGHGPWTELNATGGHPAANAQGDAEVHWAMRRWVSEADGDFLIKGQLNNVSAAGDGTVGRILVNGEEVWSKVSNGTVEDLDLLVTLTTGAVVDFAIDSDGAGNFDPTNPSTIASVADGNDGTNFWFRISRAVLFTPVGGVAGDFNGDGLLTAADVDELSVAVINGGNEARFDLNNDNLVNSSDRDVWVNDLKKTYYGDSNLDGEFSSSDLVSVFTSGEYEDTPVGNSGWAEGDWNGDLDFTSADFVTAFAAGGYEIGPRAAVSAVPEPTSVALLAGGMLLLAAVRGRHR